MAVVSVNHNRIRSLAAEGNKKAVVIQDIDNLAQTGQVRINDIERTARTADDSQKIGKGAVVLIEEIRGVKLIVKQNKED